MGAEALEAAIENYRTGETKVKNLEEKMVCNCFGVSENEMRRVIIENNLSTVEAVTDFTKAGGACGKCRPDIERILKEIIAERESGGK
jgi:NifU-like protein